MKICIFCDLILCLRVLGLKVLSFSFGLREMARILADVRAGGKEGHLYRCGERGYENKGMRAGDDL